VGGGDGPSARVRADALFRECEGGKETRGARCAVASRCCSGDRAPRPARFVPRVTKMQPARSAVRCVFLSF
jgi:hypothetical protein